MARLLTVSTSLLKLANPNLIRSSSSNTISPTTVISSVIYEKEKYSYTARVSLQLHWWKDRPVEPIVRTEDISMI